MPPCGHSEHDSPLAPGLLLQACAGPPTGSEPGSWGLALAPASAGETEAPRHARPPPPISTWVPRWLGPGCAPSHPTALHPGSPASQPSVLSLPLPCKAGVCVSGWGSGSCWLQAAESSLVGEGTTRRRGEADSPPSFCFCHTQCHLRGSQQLPLGPIIPAPPYTVFTSGCLIVPPLGLQRNNHLASPSNTHSIRLPI